MSPFPTSEILVLLLLIVFLFIFFFPSVFEPKSSKGKRKGTTDTQSEKLEIKKHKVDVEPFLGLENLEKEEHEEKRSEKAAPHACNPILVLANIEG